MVLIDLCLEDLFHLFFDVIHLVDYIIVRVVLSVIDRHFVVDFSHHVVQLLIDVLVHLLDVHLLVIQSLVDGLVVSLISFINVVQLVIHVLKIISQSIILFFHNANFFLDLGSSSVLQQVNVVLDLLDSIF